jgi:hypothetical protein
VHGSTGPCPPWESKTPPRWNAIHPVVAPFPSLLRSRRSHKLKPRAGHRRHRSPRSDCPSGATRRPTGSTPATRERSIVMCATAPTCPCWARSLSPPPPAIAPRTDVPRNVTSSALLGNGTRSRPTHPLTLTQSIKCESLADNGCERTLTLIRATTMVSVLMAAVLACSPPLIYWTTEPPNYTAADTHAFPTSSTPPSSTPQPSQLRQPRTRAL